MKYKVAMILSLLLVVGLSVPINATEAEQIYDVNIYVNDQKVTFNSNLGYPFIDDANRTQMPLRIVIERMGATVSWDNINKIATVVKGTIKIQVPTGEKYILKNDVKIKMDTTSRIISNRVYLPLRAIVEALGSEVTWDATTRNVRIKSVTKPSISRLPTTYDLRTFKRLTGVKDQHDIGACWAFATLGAIESALLPNAVYDFSEDHMSLTHGYNLSQDEGGDFQISLAYLARWSGPVYEVEDPYGDGITDTSLKAAIHVQEALILPTKDFSAIKRAVIAYGGVQTSIHIKDIQDQVLGEAYNPLTNSFYYNGTAKPNHDVVIVGWDNNYGIDRFTTTPERAGAFICRNSYGDYFGDAGYFYVSYEDTWIGDESVVYSKIESADNYDRIYQSDWLGWVGRIGYGSDTAYFSNVYTTSGEETLEAVSFYATDTDTSYEVYVVPSFSGVEDYDQKIKVESGSYDYAGYYTVDFKTPISVDGTYAVVVKVTTPDSLFPVAAEFYKNVPWLKSVDLSDGQGYMSTDGKVWESTEDILESNVSLKAFTNRVGQPTQEPETAPATETPDTEGVDVEETPSNLDPNSEDTRPEVESNEQENSDLTRTE